MSPTGTPLGEAFVPIRATLDKLDQDLAGAKGKISSALDQISGTVQKAGKIALAGISAGVVAIGAGIVAIAGKAVPAASNLNESINAVNVVFGDAADTVLDFGKTASDTAGLSASAFNQLAAQTGAMLQNFGLGADDAAQATVDLGQRAADMASIFNTDVDEALTAINAALRGEADPIERFGVSMNAAAVEAKALEMGLGGATGELDQAALTQARLALLFEQTDKIAGDFVNTSGDLANASRVQAARWENFMAMVGSFALPILNSFQGLFLDLGERVFPIIIEAIAPVAEIIQLLAEDFTELINNLIYGEEPIATISNFIGIMAEHLGLSKDQAEALSTGFQDLILWIQETITNIMAFIEPIIEAVSNFVSFQDVLLGVGVLIASFIIPTVISLVASFLPIIATVGAIIGIVALLRNAWENDWGGIRTNLTAWWNETGQPIFDLLRAWLGEKIPLAIQVLSDFWTNTLQPAIKVVFQFLTGVLIPFFAGTVFPWLKDKLTAALTTLANFWTNTLQPAIQVVWSWLSTVLIPFLTDVLFPWLSEKLTEALSTLSDFWLNTLKPALDTVWSFIKEDLIPLFEALWELFNVAGSLALEALSGLWQNTLKPALDAVWSFIKENIIPIFEALNRNINDDLAPVLQWLADTVLSGVSDAFDGIKQAIQFVIEKVKSLIEKLKSITLPPALTPGSPTPFEIGLLGINQALGDFNKLLDQNTLISGGPGLSMSFPVNPLLNGAGSEILPPATNINYNANTTVNTNQDPLRVLRASRHLDKLGEIP